MEAIILAGGKAERLGDAADGRPKALVEVAGRTLLELTLARLRAFGICDVIINTHHFADRVADYLRAHHDFAMHIEISREEVLLDTGGGLKQAAHFFDTGSDADEPFLVHNVDVISNIDFSKMLSFHQAHQALATLAVQDRPTSRYLLFDEHHQLCGRQAGSRQAGVDGTPELVRKVSQTQALAFSGIHIISPRIFSLMNEAGAFSIIPVYLRLAAHGEPIFAFSADCYYWRDLGRPEHIDAATQDIKNGRYTGDPDAFLSR